MENKVVKIGILILVFFCIVLAGCSDSSKNDTTGNLIELDSPQHINTIKFELDDEGALYYSVFHKEKRIVQPSKMGFVLQNKDSIHKGFSIDEVRRETKDEVWETTWGEFDSIRNAYNGAVVKLDNKRQGDRKLEIEFRAFDDGVAFRYRFAQPATDSIFIMDELTEFDFVEDGEAWWIPAYREDRYEYLYKKSKLSELDTVHTPLTIEKVNNAAVSIHEANLKDFPSFTLAGLGDNTLKVDLVPWSDGVKYRGKEGFLSSWRTIQISDRPIDLASSTMVLNLNDPNQIENTDWIHPLKYIGIWWGMHIGKYTFWEGSDHGASTENTERYIDYAHQLGINNLLIEGWNKGWTPQWYEDALHKFDFIRSTDDFDLEEVTTYGRKNDVAIIGYHETGSNIDNYLEQVDEAFRLYREMGIRHVKIGHVGSKLKMKEYHHGQFGVEYYRSILKKAAEYGLTVNFHEPIKDTGERRTFPNMMTREGARGQEYNAWSEGNPPNHTTILPYTRMLSGPMDFTPGIFDVEVSEGYPGKRVWTTRAKQLALYVILYSPVQMLADLPENYLNQPEFQFLKDVPTDWSKTVPIDGEIGKFVVIARKDRDSGDWYLGAITNEEEREIEIPLSFLDRNHTYEAQLYKDGESTHFDKNPTEVEVEKRTFQDEDRIRIRLGRSGGAAIRFVRE